MCRGAPTLDRYDGDKTSIRLAYDTTVPFEFKWDVAHRRRHDNDTMLGWLGVLSFVPR